MLTPVPASAAEGKTPLLFLCHRIPYPPNKGDKIRSFHLLQHLSQHFAIYLAGFIDDAADWQWVPEVGKLCADVCLRPLVPWQATLRSATGLLTGQALSLPYYSDRVLARWVQTACAQHNIRHALVYSSVMAQFLPADGAAFSRTIIDFVDVDSDKWQQYARQKLWPMSWLYRREGRRLLDYERTIAARADAGLFVSSAEAQLFRQLSPATAHKTGFCNNGVDCIYFDPDCTDAAAQHNPFPAEALPLVFTGAMDYWPNIDAVVWFAGTVFPHVRQHFPRLEFYIVGGNPAPAVCRLAQLPGVTVTGRVPDVRPYLRHALAAVAPMRLARGVQNKVLEGMAMALPVLVSHKGLEGIDAQHGTHVIVAETAQEYAAAIGDILQGSCAEMGRQGRQLVQQAFNWSQSLPEVVALLQQPDALPRGARGPTHD